MRVSHDQVANFSGPSEWNFVHKLMLSQCSSSLTKAWHNIQDSRWETCLICQFSKHKSSKRSLLGRFKHNSAANSKGWCTFPGHHEQRVVPWNNLCYHSNWLFYCHSEEAFGHVQSTAFYFVAHAREVSVNGGREGDILSSGILQRFSIVECFIVSQVFKVRFYKLRKLKHNISPFPSTHLPPWPIIECFPGCLDCIINIFHRGGNSMSYHLLCCWVVDLEFLSAFRIDEFPVDEEFPFNLF